VRERFCGRDGLDDDFDILVERDEKAEQAFDQLELFWDDPTSEP
jgi:hypothetical protein